jgi:hypothetical protein
MGDGCNRYNVGRGVDRIFCMGCCLAVDAFSKLRHKESVGICFNHEDFAANSARTIYRET